MKKFIITLLTLALVVPTVNAQTEKELKAQAKQIKKEVKAKVNEYKKGGWTLYGSSRPIEAVLTSHYEKLYKFGSNNYEIMGDCSQFKSKNIGHQTCINNASLIYAQAAGRKVNGRVNADFGYTGNVKEEFEHFYAAYESQVQSEINGELQESFCVIREIKRGIFEMQTFFIVSEDAATQARIRAYKNALKESESAQKYADSISKFIQEGVDPNLD